MDPIETRILRERWDVEPRLKEMALNSSSLLRVAALASHERGLATPFHAANAAGTFAYQTGTWALRDIYVGQDGWVLDRLDGVEAIYNSERRIRVIYSNVDVSCSDFHNPKPRSEKGSGAERSCSGNLFGFLPSYAPRQTGPVSTFYLMVDGEGAAELTQPVIRGGTFSAYVERIYLSSGGGEDPGTRLSLDDDDTLNNFDPQVARK